MPRAYRYLCGRPILLYQLVSFRHKLPFCRIILIFQHADIRGGRVSLHPSDPNFYTLKCNSVTYI
nr:MAG TPA: hypothetical protein [Caudoviricetes sp.]